MAVKLTDEMRSEIAAHPGKAVPIIDPADSKVYYLIDEQLMHGLQNCLDELDAAQIKRLRSLVEEGANSGYVKADEAERRMLQIIQDCAERA